MGERKPLHSFILTVSFIELLYMILFEVYVLLGEKKERAGEKDGEGERACSCVGSSLQVSTRG